MYLPEIKVLEAGEVLQRWSQRRHPVVANVVVPARCMPHTHQCIAPALLSTTSPSVISLSVATRVPLLVM